MDKKPYDDSNWREEYKQYTSNKRYLELLENGPKQLSQAWVLGALYNEWKKIKGYDKYDACLLYTSPSPRDFEASRMPSSA